jgi:signal recognition particle receptor subunit beta
VPRGQKPAYNGGVSIVNPASREIAAKVVYYGPGLSGKTTSLKQVYAGIRPEARGQLISLSTEGDRTLFFDFLPVKVDQINGLALRLQLYTVPGQVFYDATRKLVLNGADGVVFVADSQRSAADANAESMVNLETNLADMGLELASFPLVLQYNKRDLPDVASVEDLRRSLNRFRAPELETVASRGDGILNALKEITRLVVRDLKSRQPRRAPPRPPLLWNPPDGNPAEAAARAARPTTAPSPTSPEQPAPAPAAPAGAPRERPALVGLSFARLFPDRPSVVAEVELLVRERAFGPAVRRAGEGVSDVLASLALDDRSTAARASLLGLDGRELLRLGRLTGRPDVAATEQDALFALYLLVSALVKAERI